MITHDFRDIYIYALDTRPLGYFVSQSTRMRMLSREQGHRANFSKTEREILKKKYKKNWKRMRERGLVVGRSKKNLQHRAIQHTLVIPDMWG